VSSSYPTDNSFLLLGDRADVLATIKNLHRRGFAEANEWSKAIACPQTEGWMPQVLPGLPPDSVVSILTKHLPPIGN
jgi:hypothetical protein